jgi:hypothetical protein
MHLHRQQGTIEPGLVRMIHATPDGTGGSVFSRTYGTFRIKTA